MTRIFFYHGAQERIAEAVRLIGKAAMQKKALFVYAPDEAVASTFDRQLWSNPSIGFIPHVRSSSPLADETLVVIGKNPEDSSQNERLFNLSNEVPPAFSRFTNLIEIIDSNEANRSSGRERLRFYRDKGYEIRFFDLAGKS